MWNDRRQWAAEPDISGDSPVNPIWVVMPKERKPGLSRVLAIAEGSRDIFSLGSAIVDGFSFYHYATSARALVGVP